MMYEDEIFHLLVDQDVGTYLIVAADSYDPEGLVMLKVSKHDWMIRDTHSVHKIATGTVAGILEGDTGWALS